MKGCSSPGSCLRFHRARDMLEDGRPEYGPSTLKNPGETPQDLGKGTERQE